MTGGGPRLKENSGFHACRAEPPRFALRRCPLPVSWSFVRGQAPKQQGSGAAFELGGEVDQALDLFDAAGAADPFEGPVEGGGVVCGNLDHQIIAARGAVDGFDLWQGLDPAEDRGGFVGVCADQKCAADRGAAPAPRRIE